MTRARTLGSAVAAGLLVAALAGCRQNPPTTFGPPDDHDTGGYSDSVALADLDGDGILDAVVGDVFGVQTLLGGPPGQFGDPVVRAEVYGGKRSIDVGDLDGDGAPDIAIGMHSQVGLWEVEGDVVTSDVLPIAANVVAVRDVTSDGRDDLLALGWSTGTLTVLHQQPDGTLGEPIVHSVHASGYNDLDVGDVDGDGDADVVVMSGQLYATPDLTVLLQEPGDLVVRGSWSIDDGASILAKAVAIADVDSDGTAELVVAHGGNRPRSKVTVFEADDTGGLTQGVTFDVKDIPGAVEAGDLNGDGYDDAVVGHSGWSTVSVLYGGPKGIVGPVQEIVAGDGNVGPGGLDLADTDGDGDLDIGLVSNQAGFTHVENTWSPPPPPEPKG